MVVLKDKGGVGCANLVHNSWGLGMVGDKGGIRLL
jgi:hypothetical protein